MRTVEVITFSGLLGFIIHCAGISVGQWGLTFYGSKGTKNVCHVVLLPGLVDGIASENDRNANTIAPVDTRYSYKEREHEARQVWRWTRLFWKSLCKHMSLMDSVD